MDCKVKTCSKCGREKDLNEFYRHKHCTGGRRPECKICSYSKQGQERSQKKMSRIYKSPENPDHLAKVCISCQKEKQLEFFKKAGRSISQECKLCLMKNREANYLPPEEKIHSYWKDLSKVK